MNEPLGVVEIHGYYLDYQLTYSTEEDKQHILDFLEENMGDYKKIKMKNHLGETFVIMGNCIESFTSKDYDKLENKSESNNIV